ncbi:MAG: hypothetical protein VKK07_11425 [Merismopediaceae bacterium]|nr:hypothetical protein [Merismopediaceae bacterium]
MQSFIRKGIRDLAGLINDTKPKEVISKPIQGSEKFYRDRLAKRLNGQTEVNTSVGRIDIVTKTEIIELKNAKNWKGAIGQIKCYGHHYPNHRQRIHLFGEITKSSLEEIQKTCKKENILLTWE